MKHWSICLNSILLFDVKQLATDADESVVRKSAFSLFWLNVLLVLESFCLLLLSRELPRLGRSIGRMYCCSGQANICTYWWMDRFLERIQFSWLARQPLRLSIFELIVMARCQRLGREPEDSYEGGPNMNRCSELLAISPIYHISEAYCPHRYEIPVANSGRQRFLESWGFLWREARLCPSFLP